MGEVGYKTLAIDIETFSDVDLIKCGVYAYADSPAFEIRQRVSIKSIEKPCF